MFARIAQYRLDQRLKAAYEKHQQALVPSLLMFGFVIDVITFRSLKLTTTFILLGAYATLATAALVYVHRYDAAKDEAPSGALFSYLRFLAPLILQFTYGALLSSSFLFYWFSGSLSASWPLMILLVVLVASNEIFRNVFLRPTVQIGVYAFVLFSYFSLLFPFLFRSIDAWTFVLGGICSTVIALALVMTMAARSSSRATALPKTAGVVMSVFIAYIALYFLNVIPPVPLAIRDAGIYHDVRSQAGEYALIGDDENALERLLPGQTIAKDTDGRLYAYAAIFAPADLQTTIFHRWQRYDPDAREWVTTQRSSYAIRGGREEGYRGYTFTTRLAPGRWRVIIETERGQVLGRLPFTLLE